ncbi:hypothetical protein CC78DRAFT_532305 [Lojkania enalia]|uniref:Uncharacterized protein n=1 Tax=Lojkania enalia TaxID=147567 RepID=A0A9P4KBR2_9PLEO|nr:hypothetical protein CC78DRAFT_532305 [Didymosphaeria enalia]
MEEMFEAIRRHKQIMKRYLRQGAGMDAHGDAGDIGYTMNDVPGDDKRVGEQGSCEWGVEWIARSDDKGLSERIS